MSVANSRGGKSVEMSICVVVTCGKDNVDKATVGFSLANAALENGEQVCVVLLSEGVRLAVKGYAEGINFGEPFQPMRQLVTELLEHGGALVASIPCLKKRNIKEEYLLPEVRQVTATEIIRILTQADRSIQLS